MGKTLAVSVLLGLAMGCQLVGATSDNGTEVAPVAEPTSGGEQASRDDGAAPAVAHGDNPLTRCRVELDYNRCVVDRLEGQTKSEGELVALIQSHRMLGDADSAKRNMSLFVERYPESPQSMTYEEYLRQP